MKVIEDLAENTQIIVEGNRAFCKERLLEKLYCKFLIVKIKANTVRFTSDLRDFIDYDSVEVKLDDEVPRGTFFYTITYLDDVKDDYTEEISSTCHLEISNH